MKPHIREVELMQTYDAELDCFVSDIRICPDTGVGVLSTFGDRSPDMSACIERFEELDRELEEIQVVNWFGDQAVLDGCFLRVDGCWQAFVYPHKRRQTL